MDVERATSASSDDRDREREREAIRNKRTQCQTLRESQHKLASLSLQVVWLATLLHNHDLITMLMLALLVWLH